MRRVGWLCVWISCLWLGACFGGGNIVDGEQDSGGLTGRDADGEDAELQDTELQDADAQTPVDAASDGGETAEDTSGEETCRPSNGGVEICDEQDNDCDGETDEDFELGTACTVGAGACEQTGQNVCAADGTVECDATPSVPGEETCSDAVDNDCDGETDEDDASDAGFWYADGDGDGFGDPDVSTKACEQPAGYVDNDTDCDDTDGAVHTVVTGYADQDADAFTAGGEQTLCTDGTLPSGYVASERAGDCDDSDPTVNPSATETCDGKDNDCDGQTDDASADNAVNWYVDCDGDGFAADTNGYVVACDKPTISAGCASSSADWTQTRPISASTIDCNDDVADAYPGQTSYFTRPMAASNYNEKWDYNCNGFADYQFERYSADCDSSCNGSGGWTDNFAPACGQQDTFKSCPRITPNSCYMNTSTRTQPCN